MLAKMQIKLLPTAHLPNAALSARLKPKSKKEIKEIKLEDGTTTSDPEKIALRASEFYQTLYARPKDTPPPLESSWSPRELVPAKENRPFTTEEIERVVRAAPNNSAPGPDSLPYNVWKSLSSDNLQLLTDAFNDITANNFPAEMSESTLTLLFKTGEVTEIKNYRPISLLNTDWKILSSTILNRLAPYISKNVSLTQTGYMTDRWSLNGILSALVTLKQIAHTHKEGGALSLDLTKAFDSLLHTLVIDTLERIRCPDKLLNIIRQFLQHGCAKILVNSTLSPTIRIERGVRQGDPLSGPLFVLAIEPLLHNLRNLPLAVPKSLPNTAYCDDILQLLLKQSQQRTVLEYLHNTTASTGLAANKDKTKWIKATGPNDYEKVLGFYIPDLQHTLDVYIAKMEKTASNWSKLLLPLATKILVAKSYLLPILQYPMFLCPPTKAQIDKI
jgi:hypothetical protein